MSDIINHASVQCKTLPSQSSNNRKKYSRRPWLSNTEFNRSHAQKRMWIKAAVEEFGVYGNETKVLKALCFLLCCVYGTGNPSIGAIQEKILQNDDGHMHYNTIRRCLARLVLKGVITSQFMGAKKTNYYTLIGFQYESESCYSTMVDSPNSFSSPKGERERKSKINHKTAFAFANACHAVQDKEELPTEESRMKAKSMLEEMRKMLKNGNGPKEGILYAG